MAESLCLRLSDSIIADVFYCFLFFVFVFFCCCCFFFFFFLFTKIKQFHSSKVSFQKRFSSSDHLNVMTTNINIYFDYILAKTRLKMVTIKQYYGCARA